MNISANELNVSWERPNEIDINGILRYYIIDYYILNQDETMTSVNVSGDTLYTVLSGLNNFTTYNVSVAAFTVGAGPSSTELETTSENGELCTRKIDRTYSQKRGWVLCNIFRIHPRKSSVLVVCTRLALTLSKIAVVCCYRSSKMPE